jgi:hypothetical protein
MVNPGLISGSGNRVGGDKGNDEGASGIAPLADAGHDDPLSPLTRSERPEGYLRLIAPTPGCRLPTLFWLGAAAIVLIFSFFGFLASRLLRCSPFDMAVSPRFDGC